MYNKKNFSIEKPEMGEEEIDKIMLPSLEESLEVNGIIILEDNSPHTPLYCKKLLLDMASSNLSTIRIFINSGGGDLFSFFSLHDTISHISKKKEVIATVCGVAASAAALALQAASVRLATENSFLMLHEISYLFYGKTSESERELALTKQMQKKVYSIWADKMGISVKELHEIIDGNDFYVDARKAKKLGLIDDIV